MHMLRGRLSWQAATLCGFTIRAGHILDRRDLDIALDVDRYDFAIRTVLEGGRPVARAEIIVRD